GHTAVRASHRELHDAAMLLRRERRILAGGAAGNEEVRSLFDLKVEKALKRGFVERAVSLEGRDEGHAQAVELCGHEWSPVLPLVIPSVTSRHPESAERDEGSQNATPCHFEILHRLRGSG